MIRFGPAGIPLSCKARTLRDGIQDIHNLGLTAMEIQFIKVNALVRPVNDEEVGKRPREVAGQLLVEVGPPPKGTTLGSAAALGQPLTRKSTATALTWFLAKDYNDLTQARGLSRAVDVRLSLHAPYYVDLVSSEAARQRSLHQLQWSASLADALGAHVLVGHLGFYGPHSQAEGFARITQEVKGLRKYMDDLPEGSLLLAVEPSGHPEVCGSKEEILELARGSKGVVPVLNLAHIASREGKKFEDRVELQALLDEFVEASRGELYLNFSGVEFYGPGEFRLTPVKRGSVHFDVVADLLAEREYDATVISSSPLLEHDAMYMKLLYERALAKRFARRHAASVAAAAKPALVAKPAAPAKPAPPKAAPKAASKATPKTATKPAPKPSGKAASKPAKSPRPAKPRPKTASRPSPKKAAKRPPRPAPRKGSGSHGRKR